MTNVFIIHGIESGPRENWFGWLKKELKLLGCRVIAPQFPGIKNPTLDKWTQVLNKYKNYLDENAIVIGHSLGVAFLLNILEKTKVKAAFMVASVSGPLDNEFDESMKTFSHKKFDWNKIKANCKRFYVFHSDNDEYIPLEKGRQVAKNLNAEFILVKNAGHFNKKSEYTKFELLLNKIKKIL